MARDAVIIKEEETEVVDKNIPILVVDDFASMRMQINGLLQQMGFKNVYEARDGKEAMSLLERKEIDLIISDCNMPEVSGLDLLRHVRGHKKLQNLPFLMVTAISEKETVIAAVEERVSNYVVKPFAPETLEMKIRAILGSTEPLWEKK
jgi:two-component system, chemotaxis family, chemotaxis protein CheY